jgi:1-acyl-sn-glycerol-3-phosphate acyltransferase
MNASGLPASLQLDQPHVERWLRRLWLARWVPSVLHDLEHLPRGGVLLVGNHGPLALDTGLLLHAFHRDTGEFIRGLSDRMLFSNPIGRQMVRNLGAVVGTRENARALLAHGELVLVYPGGARETTRDPAHRYELDWDGRLGFARIALECQVPIVPVACIGADDLFMQLLDRNVVRASPLGRLAAQLVKADYIPPVYWPKLRATEFHYYFGRPIAPPAVAGLSEQELESAVEAHRERVKVALEERIQHGLTLRRERAQNKARK